MAPWSMHLERQRVSTIARMSECVHLCQGMTVAQYSNSVNFPKNILMKGRLSLDAARYAASFEIMLISTSCISPFGLFLAGETLCLTASSNIFHNTNNRGM